MFGYIIVLYRLSTSNHNSRLSLTSTVLLSYIVFLHQTTTCHELKPLHSELSYIVFLHQTTTLLSLVERSVALSYIVFLHQTTTLLMCILLLPELSYIVFLHQTTTVANSRFFITHCLISSFYIKPQLDEDKSKNN